MRMLTDRFYRMGTLSRQDVVDSLTRLGELAAGEGGPIELVLAGGGIMVLVLGTRLATRDLDVVILPPSDPALVRRLAAVVAGERHWPIDWINDAVKGFMTILSPGPIIFAAQGINVRRPSYEQLLAMKLCAWRDDVDIQDAKRLMMEIRGDYNDVWQRLQDYLQPGRELEARYAFDDLWEDLHGAA
jgi:hypothetical protein